MDATSKRCWALAAFCFITTVVHAGTFKTANFVVTASSDDIARRVANCAEYWRHELAIQWVGKPLPNWYQPCPISVQAGQMGAGGQTTFTFENGEVFGWKMQVQGTLERILDSVIPHEVNHTIFASHFRRPVPRWADEGAATLFEHESEKANQTARLNQVLHTNKRIPLRDLLTIREYPADMQDVLTLYAEGYSLAGFLVGSQGEQGRQVFMKLLDDAHKIGWEKAIERHYGYTSLASLEDKWTGWIVAGSPAFLPAGQSLAQADVTANSATTQPTDPAPVRQQLAAVTPEDSMVVRSQSPETEEETPAVSSASRAPSALPPIPRQLRQVPVGDGEQSSITTRSNEIQTASAPSRWPTEEDFAPRKLRQKDSAARPSDLVPTTNGIESNPRSESFAFPEARRSRPE